MNTRFDEEHITDLIGRHVAIDVVVYDHDETLVERKQLHGVVSRVSEGEGLVVKLIPTGHNYRLPPDRSQFEPVLTSPYVLETSGESIDGVVLKTTHRVHLPPPEIDGQISDTLY
jgi:hypothetical protein